MIEVLPSTGSTNADLAARIAAGEAPGEGAWLVADRQTAGRGRLGRVWSDGQGNFMGSTMVRVCPADPLPATLALVAGLAVHGAVSSRLPPLAQAQLKWPNDLMIARSGGIWAKLAGILLERVGDLVVIGIGVNLRHAPPVPGREVIALSAFGPAPDRDLFAHDLAAAFAVELGLWRGFGLEHLIPRWLAVAHQPGTPLRVGDPGADVPIEGRFTGLAPDGALRLSLADGTTRIIHAGDIRLAGE